MTPGGYKLAGNAPSKDIRRFVVHWFYWLKLDSRIQLDEFQASDRLMRLQSSSRGTKKKKKTTRTPTHPPPTTVPKSEADVTLGALQRR